LPDPPDGNTTPVFTINGFQPTGTATSSVSRSKTLQLLDNLSWTRGPHTLKFGGDIRPLSAYFSNVFASDRSGKYPFNGSGTHSLDVMPFATFFVGIPQQDGYGPGHFGGLERSFCPLRGVCARRVEAIPAADDQLWNGVGISPAVSRRFEQHRSLNARYVFG